MADEINGRLTFDLHVSERSPVVKGTWITVDHVVGLVVDGWTWSDILRAHPEMTADDIRACLVYSIAEESEGPPMADEIADANVIRVHFNGYRWYAEVGPKDLGLIADGRTAAVALASLAVKCGSLRWPFDESWKPG